MTRLARALPALLLAAAPAASREMVFRPAAIAEWPLREFDGRTQYALDRVEDRPAVLARAEDSAAALYREVEIDLAETPCLEWS